jgi:beta-lactamase regulating signal transducer with metallopeptidase domain
MTSSLHAIAQLLALRFVDSVAEGTVICVLAGLALRLAPRQNAATRFSAWFSALVAIVALPWISRGWPHPSLAVGATRHPVITLPESWALYSLSVWGVVVVWFAVGIFRALWHLNVLRRNGVPVNPVSLDRTLRETLQRHGAGRHIVLCTSDQVRVPTAVGLFKPTILVPSWVMRELSSAELNQILLHELAHFRRWDDWTNLAQQIVKAVFFFHPAVWWIDRKVAVEREMACDDAVLAETGSPRAYAECLAHLTEKSFIRRSIALAQAALGKVRQTSQRVAQILDMNRPAPSSRYWSKAASLVAVLAVSCGVLYSRAPKLIAFGNSAPPLPIELASIAGRSSSRLAYVPKLPIAQAKLNIPVRQTKLTGRMSVRQVPNAERLQNARSTAVELAKSTSALVPVTQTFWVVVERGGMNPADPPVYQIQMWRVTVLRTVITAPNRQVSQHEI